MKKSFFCAVILIMSAMAFAKNPIAVIKTTMGDIEVELMEEKAPITVKNFLKYIEEKKYDGTIFHRVIDGFMIQGGGFTNEMKQVESYAPIKNEATNGLLNTEGTIAMARTSVVDSATNQFFINVNDNNFLNHRSVDQDGYGYAVFGRVIKGMITVNKIKKVKTGNNGYYQNVPIVPVVINSIRLKK